MEFYMIILCGILVGFPAALILTAIVIGFAVTCLLISIYIANYKLKGSDNVIDLEDVENMKEERNNA